MGALDDIELHVSSFTKTDRAVYEAVKRFPADFAQQGIVEIARLAGVSEAAVTRFAKRVGYSGFSELQFRLRNEAARAGGPEHSPSSELASMFEALMERMEELMRGEACQRLVDSLKGASLVVTSGASLSRIPAYYLSVALNTMQFSCSCLQADELPRRYFSKTVIMVFSVASGAIYSDLLKELSQSGETPYKTLITMNAHHPLRRRFDNVIVLPQVPLNASTNLSSADYIAFLLFVDLLRAQLAR